ncbi:MAG: T9SS type A sorting domain-containing protein [Prolixibacteraceae bacterium]
MHLAQGSDLIDSGTDLGLPFKGILPDLGAFESDFSTGITSSLNKENDFRACFVQDELIILLNNPQNETVLASLYKLNGQVALNFSFNGFDQAQHMNCNQLPQGIYILKLTSGTKLLKAQKVIKVN